MDSPAIGRRLFFLFDYPWSKIKGCFPPSTHVFPAFSFPLHLATTTLNWRNTLHRFPLTPFSPPAFRHPHCFPSTVFPSLPFLLLLFATPTLYSKINSWNIPSLLLPAPYHPPTTRQRCHTPTPTTLTHTHSHAQSPGHARRHTRTHIRTRTISTARACARAFPHLMIMILEFVFFLAAFNHFAAQMVRVLLVDVLQQRSHARQLMLFLLTRALRLTHRGLQFPIDLRGGRIFLESLHRTCKVNGWNLQGRIWYTSWFIKCFMFELIT